MSTVEPRSHLAAYSADEIAAIVALRCQELSDHLGWSVAPPAVRVLGPSELRDAAEADVQRRSEAIRGRPREEGLLAELASWLLGFFGPSLLGYFGTSQNTLFLNGELGTSQAGYVLMHELVHAAQWQRFPGLFARIDAGRVAAEDLADQQGEQGHEAQVARDHYEALVTFLEGHATFHARRACESRLRRNLPDASDEEIRAFVEALMGLDLTDETTTLIYVRGEALHTSLEPAQVEAMFREPDEIVRRLSRR